MSANKRIVLGLLLVALAALGFSVFDPFGIQDDEGQLRADYRVPVANPPQDPNRPDLFEEPTIDDQRR